MKPLSKKLEIMWQDGVYLGVKAATDEVVVGTAEGIFRTRTVRKKPKEDRRGVKHMDMIGGVPWRTQNGDEATDGERLTTELRPDQAEQVSTEVEKENLSKEIAPKVFTITKEGLDTHGYSKGCRGCTAVLRGNRAQTYTAGCRQRLERKMQGVEKVKTAKKTMDEYVAKVIEKDVEDEKDKRRRPQRSK